MADNKADGSIVIDTGLDTKGFDKGSKELLTAINSLTKEIERLGQTLQTTFSNYGNVAQNSDTKVQKLEQTVVQLEARVQELNATIAEMEEKLADASQQKPMDADAFEQTGASADDAKSRIAQLEEQISSLESYIDQLHTQMASGSDTIAPVMDTNQIYDGVMDLDEAFKTLESDMTDLEAVAEQAFAGDNAAVQEFKEGVSDTQSKIAEMERALEEFGATQIPTEDYAFLQSEYDKCDKKLEKLLDKQARMEDTGVKKNSKAWKNLQYDIEQTRVQMDTYKDDMAEMENTGTAFTLGSDTAEFAGYYKQLMEAKQALEELAAEVQQFGGQVKSTWANMTTLSGMLKNAFSSVGRAVMTGAGYAVQAIRHPIQSLDRLLGGLVKTAGRVAGSLAKMAGRAVVSGLKAIANAAKKAAKNLASMAGSAIKGGFSKIASLAKKAATSLLGIGSGAKKSDIGLKNGLKTVLKYAFGIRSLYVLCNKLKSAIKDGFGSLAQYSPQVNSAVSSMQGALSTLKLSLSTAFAPIVTAVAPAITYLINLLTAAVNAIGMFFAAITGQKTYTKATAQVADYAASQSDAASSTGDAADAAKEEKKQLASFDDLDILEDNSSDGSGGGGGGSGGGSDPSTMFETVPVDSGIAGFVQKIKELFEEGDYEEIGRIIAQKINEAFAKVKELIAWENVGAVVTEYVNAFCRIFNSLVDNIDWDLIGSTFAEGINTLLHTIELLLTGIDWSNFGTKIGEGLNGMVRDIEWDLLGETFAAYFSAKLNLLTSAVQEFDWGQLGSKMSEGINSLVSTMTTTITAIDWKGIGSNFITGVNNLVSGVNWTEVGNLLAQSFNAALGMIYSVVTDFKWSEAGKKFGEGVNGIISNVNWADIGQTISNSLTGALNFLFNAIKEINWTQLGEDVKTALVNINWSEICQALFEALGAALAGLSQFLGGLFGDAVEGAKDYFNGKIEECGGNIVAGIFKGIKDAIAGIGTWIKENIVDPFVNGFKELFGIQSPSTVMAELGSFLIEGLLQGILDVVSGIKEWIKEHVTDPIKKCFENFSLAKLLDTALDLGDKAISVAVSLIKSGWSTLTGWVGEIGSKAVSLAKSGWKTISSWVGDIGSKAVSLAKSGWKTISSWVGEIGSKAVSLAKSGWSTLSSWAGEIGSKSVSLVKSGWTTLSSWVGEISSKSVKLIKSGWTTLSSWVGEIGNKTVSLVKSGWITLSSWVGEIGSKAVSLVKSGWTTLRVWVGEIGSKSVSLIKSGWTTLRSWVGEIGSKAVSLVKSGWKSLSSWVGTKVSVGISLFKSGWRSLSSWIGTSVSVGVSLFKSGWRSIRSFFGLSSGGIVGANGGVKLFASGGSISRNGVANWWNSIPKYANGTNNAHGTVFVAGEAGPEIVGNVNGKTEVLNKSQLAATMYAAIVNGLSACVNPLWSAISGMMANCTNAIIASMAYLAEQDVSVDGIRADAISGSGENATLIATLQALADRVAYQVPVAATGAVSPYGVKSAASSTESIKSAIDASNDELISVVMQSVTNATTAIVGAIQTYSGTEVNLDANSLSTAIINEINRRTRAYGQSPLVGV